MVHGFRPSSPKSLRSIFSSATLTVSIFLATRPGEKADDYLMNKLHRARIQLSGRF